MLENIDVKITRKEVQEVARLARLQFSPAEEEILTQQLDEILQYMEKLNEIDTTHVEPLAHVIDIVNAFREDRAASEPAPENLLANAPAKHNGFFKVPKIIE